MKTIHIIKSFPPDYSNTIKVNDYKLKSYWAGNAIIIEHNGKTLIIPTSNISCIEE